MRLQRRNLVTSLFTFSILSSAMTFWRAVAATAEVGGAKLYQSREAESDVQVPGAHVKTFMGGAPQVKAGAFVASDFSVDTWMVGRDTLNSTTKIYYNNGGVLMSVPLT